MFVERDDEDDGEVDNGDDIAEVEYKEDEEYLTNNRLICKLHGSL